MKYLAIVVFFLINFSVNAMIFVGEIVESSSNYDHKAEHTYLLKVKSVLLGEYEWQYKQIRIHHVTTTTLIDISRELLVETVDGKDSILAVFNKGNVKVSNSKVLHGVMAEALSHYLNAQNQKHQFIHQGRLKILIKTTDFEPETMYTRVHMGPNEIIVFDYYMKNLLYEWRDFIPPNSEVAFRIEVKNEKISIIADEKYGGYYSLSTAVRKFEK